VGSGQWVSGGECQVGSFLAVATRQTSARFEHEVRCRATHAPAFDPAFCWRHGGWRVE
jgi:hypothetical protein